MLWADPHEGADELLDDLAAALVPTDTSLEPTAAELAALHHMVACRFPARAGGEVVPFRGRPRRRARLVGWAAAGALVFSASAAAASTGGLPLPDPVRAAAYAVGLPVDSPALHEAHRHLRALDDAVKDGDGRRARRVARELRAALAEVPEEERDEAEASVDEALEAAASLLDEPGRARDEAAQADARAPDPVPTSGRLADRGEMPPRPTQPASADQEPVGASISEGGRESAVTDPPEAAPSVESPAAEPADEVVTGEPAQPEGIEASASDPSEPPADPGPPEPAANSETETQPPAAEAP